MSRLISTSDLHNIVMKRKSEYGKLATLIDNIVEEMVQETVTVDAIEIPHGATNGDMIKAMLPNGTESIGRKKIYYSFYPNGDMEFNITWWNAPYRIDEKARMKNEH